MGTLESAMNPYPVLSTEVQDLPILLSPIAALVYHLMNSCEQWYIDSHVISFQGSSTVEPSDQALLHEEQR